jgi:hypothetical protein
MAHYGNVLNITSHFLNLAEENSPRALAALFCLNEFSNSIEEMDSILLLCDSRFQSFTQIADFIALLEIDIEEMSSKESKEERSDVNSGNSIENVCFRT